MKKSKKGNVDLSKLIIKRINELRWEIDIEEEIIVPEELGGNITVVKTVEFVYYRDKKNNYWLYNCTVPEKYQRQGIGFFMIKRAIEEYGQVFFSNARHLDFNLKYPDHGYDSRYLTPDGRKFVKALIRKKIIPEEWLRFPEI